MSDIHVQGLAELNQALQGLSARIEQNILRGSLRAGQKEILEAAKSRVPVASGALRASLKIKTSSKRGVVSARLVAGSKTAYYARMVEFGTAQHFIKPKRARSLFFAGLAREVVDHPGAAAHPFMRPAFDEAQGKALESMRAYIARRLPLELARAGQA